MQPRPSLDEAAETVGDAHDAGFCHGPMSPKISPGLAEKVIPSTARVESKVLMTAFTSSTA
jgi:hypothetical protein